MPLKQIRPRPALLKTTDRADSYSLHIELTNGTVITHETTDRDIIDQEYHELRASGIYRGHWIRHIERLSHE